MKTITQEMNQAFAKDAEAALSKRDQSKKRSFAEWARVLEIRSRRLVNLYRVFTPSEIEKELELIEEALEGCQACQ